VAKQTVDVGVVANDGTGDPLRTAMIKINENFTELYTNAVLTTSVSVGNSTINSSMSNTAGFYAGNSAGNRFIANSAVIDITDGTTSSNLTATTAKVGANVILTTTSIFVGNSTQNVVHLQTYVDVANTQGNTKILPTRMAIGGGTANVTINVLAIAVTNTISNTTIDAGVLTIANTSTGRANVEPGKITVGANVIVNTTIVTTPSINVTSNSGLGVGSYTMAGNGYTYLPNGLKMNWGWVSANSSDGNAVFSNAFSTAVYSVIATSNTATATYQAGVTAINLGNTNIRTANVTSTNVRWIAIGV
jgi:hypothetical protein